eukprot:TRINITY_DN25887_c0_g1_i1.p1 TRINITY_DN25887_c0_g1~~TRINITY_DN25887_c0_g1_i1.p1  ORF type:complete len:400 (+),score=23.65 TRINITY_DN25887_c0_g1_i1:22-1221(+)
MNTTKHSNIRTVAMLRVSALALPLLLCPVAARRIVAVGDLHGDLSTAAAILQSAGLVDEGGNWIGADSVLVQMGDMVDRGPEGHGIMDLMMRLRQRAPGSGGEVNVLCGNHEVMNLKGDWDFVNPVDIALHGGVESRRLAYGAGGHYGRIVRSLPLAVVVDDTLFVHGGLLPQWASLGTERLNAHARDIMAAASWEAPVLMNDGPVWTREQLYSAAKGRCTLLDDALAALSKAEGRTVTRMVVGHTVLNPGTATFLCDGRMVAIDVRASAFMEGGGWATWIEIERSATNVSTAVQKGGNRTRRNQRNAKPRRQPHSDLAGGTLRSAFSGRGVAAAAGAGATNSWQGQRLSGQWDPRSAHDSGVARRPLWGVFAVCAAVLAGLLLLTRQRRRRRKTHGSE